MVDFLLRVVEGYLKFRIEIQGIKKKTYRLFDRQIKTVGFPTILSVLTYIGMLKNYLLNFKMV